MTKYLKFIPNEPAVIGSKGLIGPINFPTNTPKIPKRLIKLLPCINKLGYLLKGHKLSIDLLIPLPIRKLKYLL